MMTRLLGIACGAALALAGTANAHGPSRQKVEMKQVLNATPDEVWAVIGHFDDMNWHPAIASTEMTPTGSAADIPDQSTRILHLQAESGDPTITEQLIGWSPDKRQYKYMITDVAPAILPVSNYSSTLEVKDNNGKAEVIWKAGFYRGFPNNDPPPELNDEAAVAAVTAVYQAGMDALAEQFGTAE